MKDFNPDMSRIVSVGDVIRECLPGLEKIAKETTAFFEKIREQVAQIDPETCDEHPEVTLELDVETTMMRSHKAGELILRYRACHKCVKHLEDSLVNEKWRKIGIPDKVLHATLDNFKTEDDSQKKALTKVRKQLKIGDGFLLLRGQPGTGKTHLAAACLKTTGGLFITEADLIGELRQTYTDNSGQDEMVDKYRNAKILVLDELTVDVVGKDIPALLYRILADRYDKRLLTIITSNETLDTIVSILGARLTDRMKENYSIVTCEWESHRSKK